MISQTRGRPPIEETTDSQRCTLPDPSAADPCPQAAPATKEVMTFSNQNVALEEWKLCQSVIANQEAIIYKRQSLLVTVIGAATAIALPSDVHLLEPSGYLLLSLCIIVLFFILEVIQRLPHIRAIKRATEVEEDLRKSKYEGPNLSHHLGHGGRWTDALVSLTRIRVLAPYAVVTAGVIVFGCGVIGQ